MAKNLWNHMLKKTKTVRQTLTNSEKKNILLSSFQKKMSAMKKTLLYFPLTLSLLFVLFACQREEAAVSTYDFTVLHENQMHKITSQESLDGFIRAVVGKEEIAILEASLQQAEDRLGTFHVIMAKYAEGNREYSLAIPLNESAKGALLAECAMTCSPQPGCAEYAQTVIERCAQQKCICNPETGGAVASVVFPD
jgi:hypothetical protein